MANAVDHNGRVQTGRGGIIQADPIETLANAVASYQTGGGLYMLDLAGQTIFVAVAANATGAVAAHFTEAAVRIEKQHPIVTALKRGIYDHQTVGPNGQMAFAQSAGQSGKAGFGKMLYHIIYNDKVIAGAVHFPEPQVNHLKAWYDMVL